MGIVNTIIGIVLNKTPGIIAGSVIDNDPSPTEDKWMWDDGTYVLWDDNSSVLLDGDN